MRTRKMKLWAKFKLPTPSHVTRKFFWSASMIPGLQMLPRIVVYTKKYVKSTLNSVIGPQRPLCEQYFLTWCSITTADLARPGEQNSKLTFFEYHQTCSSCSLKAKTPYWRTYLNQGANIILGMTIHCVRTAVESLLKYRLGPDQKRPFSVERRAKLQMFSFSQGWVY